MSDKQNNEQVFRTYLVLEEKFNESIEETKLISAVNKLFPFYNTDEL